MARSTLRCAAGILLAVTLLLPGMAAAREIPSGWQVTLGLLQEVASSLERTRRAVERG